MKVSLADIPTLHSAISDRPLHVPMSSPLPQSGIGRGTNEGQYLLGIENARRPPLDPGAIETISYSAGKHYLPRHASHEDPTPTGPSSIAADTGPWRAPVMHALPRFQAEPAPVEDLGASSWRAPVFHPVPR
jgi:hypothetical protein